MLHNLYHTQKKIQKHLTLISLLQFKPLIPCLSTMDRESRWFPPFLWQPWQLPPCFPGQSTLQMLSLFHISSSLFFFLEFCYSHCSPWTFSDGLHLFWSEWHSDLLMQSMICHYYLDFSASPSACQLSPYACKFNKCSLSHQQCLY